MRLESSEQSAISGQVQPGFELVREEFERNFLSRGERGAACAIYHRGIKVVDLWGGHRCTTHGHPWEPGTLSLAFSATKGMAATAMAVAHSRGLFELDQPVANYWPEFASHGKERITVRQLLSHQAGLLTVGRLDAKVLADHDQLAELLADGQAVWKPGARHGYHTLTLGWYQNELIRRVDPRRRSIGTYFQDEVARPLGAEFYFGLPASIPEDRVSNCRGYHRIAALAHLHQLPPLMILSGIWPGSCVAKSVNALRLNDPADLSRGELRRVEIPSANGFGQARGLARIYDVLSRGGGELGLAPKTWHELTSRPELPPAGTRDAVLKIDTKYSFGFSRPSRGFAFGADQRAFGCPGAGGAFGFADPSLQLGFAYLTNEMSFRIFDDPRERAVREAAYQCAAGGKSIRRRIAA